MALIVRKYAPGDRAAIRAICVETAWMGEPAPELIGDEFLWAEFWTRFYTDEEPEHTWVVADPASSTVHGYFTSAFDVRKLDRFTPKLIFGLAGHVIRKRLLRKRESRAVLFNLARGFLRGDTELPKEIKRRYPATFHFNLLPDVRGRGYGSELFKAFERELRETSPNAGIHVQTMSLNQNAARFFRKNGFELFSSRKTKICRHYYPDELAIETWVRDSR